MCGVRQFSIRGADAPRDRQIPLESARDGRLSALVLRRQELNGGGDGLREVV
jgi:hypothetical protein